MAVMSDGYRNALAEALAGVHTVTAVAKVTNHAGVVQHSGLPVTDLTWTLDGSSSLPFSARLTVPARWYGPDGVETLLIPVTSGSPLTPYGNRIHITMTVTAPSGAAAVVSLPPGLIMSTQVAYPDQKVVIEVGDIAEELAQIELTMPMPHAAQWKAVGNTTRKWVEFLCDWAGGKKLKLHDPMNALGQRDDVLVDSEASPITSGVIWQPGTTVWDAIVGLGLARGQARIFFNRSAELTCLPQLASSDPSSWALADVGTAGTPAWVIGGGDGTGELVEISASITRKGLVNRVVALVEDTTPTTTTPAPVTGGTPAQSSQAGARVVAQANKYLGAGGDHFWQENGIYGAWCGLFVNTVFREAGFTVGDGGTIPDIAYTGNASQFGAAPWGVIGPNGQPQPGDLYFLDPGDNGHVGIVADASRWNGGSGMFTTIEGNWGGQVSAVERHIENGVMIPDSSGRQLWGFGRPAWPAALTAASTPTAVAQAAQSNREYIYRSVIAKGYLPEQAAAIIGNLMQESGCDPGVYQGGGGPGRGIAQWTESERWATLCQWAQGRGDPWSLPIQVAFMLEEMATNINSYNDNQFRGIRDLTVATEYFCETYEGAGIPQMDTRIREAQQAYQDFHTITVGPSTPGTVPSNPAPSQTTRAVKTRETGPSRYDGPMGRAVKFLSRQQKAPGLKAADKDAANYLVRHNGLVRTLSLRTLALPHLDPGDIIKVRFPGTTLEEEHVVLRVSMTLPGGLTEIDCRAYYRPNLGVGQWADPLIGAGEEEPFPLNQGIAAAG